MRGATMKLTEELVTEDCCNCGITFAVPKAWRDERYEDHRWFYCPNGHTQHYTGKTEAQKLKEELDAAKRQKESAEARIDYWRKEQEREAKAHASTKGQLTKTKKRVAGGACPCCKRTFVDVGKHMQTKHPDYANPVE